MTYANIKDRALKLINQYSIAGSPIADSYNNQSDFVLRIPSLIDDAQMFIATTAKKITKDVPLTSLPCEERGEWGIYTLPVDCWQLSGYGLLRFADGEFHRYHGYKHYGRDKIMIPRDVDGDMSVEYYRYPGSVGSEPADDLELDNSPDVHTVIPYYVAAHLAQPVDSFLYASLYNEFEVKLAALLPAPQTEQNVVEDVYGFNGSDI